MGAVCAILLWFFPWEEEGQVWISFLILPPGLQFAGLTRCPQKAPEVGGVAEHRPYAAPPGDDDHRTIGEHSDVLHLFAAEHPRTDAEHLTGGHIDELGKVVGEELAVSLYQQPVLGKPAKFQPLAHAGQSGDAAAPGVHVQFQQTFLDPPFSADAVNHVDAACAGNRDRFGEMVVSVQREGMFGHLTVRPAVNAPFVPLIGEVDPAQPVGCNAAMVFAAPSIFWQSPIFYILTGTPVGQFNPCGVGGITHPERMASPAEGPGRSVIPNGGGLKKV